MIDTHCHLIDEAFTADVDEVITNALNVDVRQIILACCDEREFQQITDLCDRYPGILFPTIGIHPENIAEDIKAQFEALFSQADTHTGIKAVGEIGIDLHWDKTRLSDQQWILEQQVRWALQRDLPILLHIRDAMPEFLLQCKESLCPMATAMGKRMRGILHCYSGNAAQAEEALTYGDFYFGIGGTVTYKKSLVPDVARAIGVDRLVLETDAPYLAPVPHRGKRNEPAYTAATCQFLAQIMGKNPEEIAQITTENAKRIFGI